MEIIVPGSRFRDKNGERIDFPKDGKPYFDQTARQVFHTPEEKKNFMNKHGFFYNGDSQAKCNKQKREYEQQKNDERRKR